MNYPIVGIGTANNKAGQFIKDRVNFIGSNFYGQVTSPEGIEPSFTSYGQLPNTHIDLMIKDNPSYIVWSYATPIAWVTSNGQWVIPSLKYSVTTSKHQSLVRGATQSWVSLS